MVTRRENKIRVSKRRKAKKIRRRPPRHFGGGKQGKRIRSAEPSALEGLFGSSPRIRLINFFIKTEADEVLLPDIAERTRIPGAVIRRECKELVRIGFLRPRGKTAWQLNESFSFAAELKNITRRTATINKSRLISSVKRLGKIRLFLVSGAFLNREEATVDIFIVADNLNERRLAAAIRQLEALVGHELRWVGMDTREFLYRWRMLDRFVRDVLSEPYEKIISSGLPMI